MSERIFVGNLPFSANNEKLNELFSKHGEVVSAEVVMDRFSDRSRGFGFVVMSTKESAAAAITALNGHQLDGRALTVNEAKPRAERSEGGDRGSRGGRSSGFNSGNRW